MRLRRDDSAASPLVVLTTFVLAAVLLTIVVYAVAFDRPEPGVSLVERRDDGGALAFEVTRSSGGLSWGEVDVRFVDRGGSDVASTFLHLPTGPIGRSDRIEVGPQPPAGTYLVQVLHDGDELARLVVTL
jgi:hypothetical protein